MSIKEKATSQDIILARNANILGETTTYSSIIDTADYDLGVYFTFCIVTNDSTSFNAVNVIQEGDESNMSDAADVPADKLVYGDAVNLSALNAAGSNVVKEAVHSTKRYLRVKTTTTGYGVDITLVIKAIVNPELQPTARI